MCTTGSRVMPRLTQKDRENSRALALWCRLPIHHASDDTPCSMALASLRPRATTASMSDAAMPRYLRGVVQRGLELGRNVGAGSQGRVRAYLARLGWFEMVWRGRPLTCPGTTAHRIEHPSSLPAVRLPRRRRRACVAVRAPPWAAAPGSTGRTHGGRRPSLAAAPAGGCMRRSRGRHRLGSGAAA